MNQRIRFYKDAVTAYERITTDPTLIGGEGGGLKGVAGRKGFGGEPGGGGKGVGGRKGVGGLNGVGGVGRRLGGG